MKTVLVSGVLLLSFFAHAETCKKGDLKDCAKVLKSKEGSDDFAQIYDNVCYENKTFKCLKITVRGDIKEEMKYQKDEHPKANMFSGKESGEDKIFILEKK